jgi:hypothetical protein
MRLPKKKILKIISIKRDTNSSRRHQRLISFSLREVLRIRVKTAITFHLTIIK